jgi:hypothetical protein
MKYLIVIIFLSVVVLADSEKSWVVSTANYKELKINGSKLNKNLLWEMPSWNQLETGNTEAMAFLPEQIYLKLSKNTLVRFSDSTLQLVAGQMYIKMLAKDVYFQIPQFFKFKLANGDLVVSHDHASKISEFEILSSSQSLMIDSDEREIVTAEGNKLSFTPEYVDGELAYDFLLNDRKIPKMKMDKDKIAKVVILDPAQWKRPVQKALETKKKVVQKAKEDDSKYICKKPNGVLSSCLFVQEGNQCVRYTCNLSGQWTLRTSFSKNELCPKSKVVKDCEWLGR